MYLHLGDGQSIALQDILMILNHRPQSRNTARSAVITADKTYNSIISPRTLRARAQALISAYCSNEEGGQNI